MKPETIFCYLDTETTSLADDRSPWEIAVIREGGDFSRLHVIVTDVDLRYADPKSLEMNGFYQRHPMFQNGPFAPAVMSEPGSAQHLPAEVAARAVEWITRGTTLVCANPSFDVMTLMPWMRENNVVPSWHYRPICVESMVAAHTGGEAQGLQNSALAMGIDPTDEQFQPVHSAKADAMLVRAIHRKFLG